MKRKKKKQSEIRKPRGKKMNKYQEALSSFLFTMHNRVKPKALDWSDEG